MVPLIRHAGGYFQTIRRRADSQHILDDNPKHPGSGAGGVVAAGDPELAGVGQAKVIVGHKDRGLAVVARRVLCVERQVLYELFQGSRALALRAVGIGFEHTGMTVNRAILCGARLLESESLRVCLLVLVN